MERLDSLYMALIYTTATMLSLWTGMLLTTTVIVFASPQKFRFSRHEATDTSQPRPSASKVPGELELVARRS